MLKQQHSKALTLAIFFQRHPNKTMMGYVPPTIFPCLLLSRGKPHNFADELTLPAVSEIWRTVPLQPPADIKETPLGNNTVSEANR